MKANVKKTWDMLSDRQRNDIIEVLRQNMYDEWDEQLCDTQIIWLTMLCGVLDEAGIDKDTIQTILGIWKMWYRRSSRIKTRKEQEDWLRPHMVRIFGEGQFPAEFIESMRNIGR